MKRGNYVVLLIATLIYLPQLHAGVVDNMLTEYQSKGATAPSSQRGQDMWHKEHRSAKDGKMRSCTTCHTKNLKVAGKHIKTGKRIDPLAPSVNNERLTERKKIEKWFKRNCKWTLGRECTVQEKSDFLSFIRTQ